MGAGASAAQETWALKLQDSSVSDVQQCLAKLAPTELQKIKVALKILHPSAALDEMWKKQVKLADDQSFKTWGLQLDAKIREEFHMVYVPYKPDDLPPKVDLRKHMTQVEDQRTLNSCAANAAAGAYEYLLKKRGDENVEVSRLFIYYVGRKWDMAKKAEGMEAAFADTDDEFFEWLDPKTRKAIAEMRKPQRVPCDSGMSIAGCMEAMELKGVCLASSWPYNKWNVNSKPTDDCFKEALKYKVVEKERVEKDTNVMRKKLSEGHPIIFGLSLFERFMSPAKGGYIPTPEEGEKESAVHGLHAMLLVGYNDRKQVFIVRNSWGESWGDKGYCYLNYDYVANPKFNMGPLYIIKALGAEETDLTPDPDDGEDPDLEDDRADQTLNLEVVEEEEAPAEEEEDGFDFAAEFTGDKLVRDFFLAHDGKLNQCEFVHCLKIHSKSEAGKNLSWFPAQLSVYKSEQTVWSPEDFDEVVKKYSE